MASVDRKKIADCPGLPAGWKRQEVARQSGLYAGRPDVYYYSPNGIKCRSKPEMARLLGKNFDLSCFDYRSGRTLQSTIRKSKRLKGSSYDYARVNVNGKQMDVGQENNICAQEEIQSKGQNNTGIRPDVNLVLPIRQTASIFKQPVTVIRTRPESKTRSDLKHGQQDPPKQLFWEKRMQGLKACDISENAFKTIDLPRNIQPAGPDLGTECLLQSIAAALHLSNQPLTGQGASRSALQKNPAVNINTEQPLVQQVVITDEDIRRQEAKVQEARKKLESIMSQR